MNPNPQVPHTRNDMPVGIGPVGTGRAELPPHRTCSCPNTHVMGMSHQNLLQAVASILDGEHKPTGGSWYCDLINELLYRAVVRANSNYSPYVFPSPTLPKTRTEWTQAYVYAEGFTLPAQEAK